MGLVRSTGHSPAGAEHHRLCPRSCGDSGQRHLHWRPDAYRWNRPTDSRLARQAIGGIPLLDRQRIAVCGCGDYCAGQPDYGRCNADAASGGHTDCSWGLASLDMVQQPGQRGWQWLALSGVITLATGILVAVLWPGNSIWLLGLILAIDLLFQGW